MKGAGGEMDTYNFIATTDNLPHSCLGGCVYTKEGDTNPGNNYCFKEGTMDTYCRFREDF